MWAPFSTFSDLPRPLRVSSFTDGETEAPRQQEGLEPVCEQVSFPLGDSAP